MTAAFTAKMGLLSITITLQGKVRLIVRHVQMVSILNPLCYLVCFCIQLIRERLSEKVHATIPKGIVGGFENGTGGHGHTAISRKVVGKSVYATIPKGNVGYDRYTLPDTVAVEPTFLAFL